MAQRRVREVPRLHREGARRRAARRRRSTRAAASSAPWNGGDNVNLAVGQGDLQATPLQLAVAYAALANDGTIVTPHLGRRSQDGNGVTLQESSTSRPQRKVKLNQRDRAVVLDGLRRAATEDGGTSADVFKGWPMKDYPVYGKTGTAERDPNPDQAWYACFVKHEDRPIVVVTTIEKGGFGATTAAPAARLILSQWLGVGDTDVPRRLEHHAMSAADPARLRAAAPAGAAGVAPAPGPAAAARHARAGRLLADRDQGRDRDDFAERPAALRQAPGGLRRRRARADVRRLAAGLLAPARVALPDLRRC